ncbi:MAG TPA: acetoacetate--CoA ligase, partial [Mycobacterium sp.]
MKPQWVPTDRDIADARVTDFARFAERRTGSAFPDYHALWRWSVEDIDGFWATLWDYFEVGDRGPTVLENG